MAAHQATRVVPWRDWDEWERVRVGLCGADPAARDVALARVDAWRTRGNVPHAVEVTAQLMECLSLIHISEPTRRTPISYAVFCLKKKT